MKGKRKADQRSNTAEKENRPVDNANLRFHVSKVACGGKYVVWLLNKESDATTKEVHMRQTSAIDSCLT